MTIRQHAEKAVDYSIRVALVSLVVVPFWICAWWMAPGDASEIDPSSSARVSQIFGIVGFVFISPAYACAILLGWLGVPSGEPFGLIYWLAAIVSIPAVWGTIIYLLVQVYHHVRRLRRSA